MVKRKKMVSGCKMGCAMSCANEVQDGVWEVDIDAIEGMVNRYLSEAEESGKYSVAGFCLKLGITRDVMDSWRDGYVCKDDVFDENVLPNEKLAKCIAMGVLHIERYWEECDKSSVQSKHVKMLERSGAFEEKKSRGIGTPPFDLGSLKKFSK